MGLPEPGKTFAILTQGCKVNQYESQALREAWTSRGLTETSVAEEADFVIINSCAVTERAVADLGKLLRPLARLIQKPRVLVVGCAVEADRERVLALPGVDACLGRTEKPAFFQPGANPGSAFPDLRITNYHRARGVTKIQDGCSHRCTYCIIPQTRGRSVSREPGQILQELEQLFVSGIREVFISGINLGQYGRDFSSEYTLWDLIRYLEQQLTPAWAGRVRLRLGSLEPSDLGHKALEILEQSTLLCPHLHISLQSGSMEILRRMGRGHYTPEQICTFLEKLRAIWPVFGLGVDMICGFPGETSAQAETTKALLEHMPLTYGHIFPYSERPGTPATSMKNQVPGHIRRERAAQLRQRIAYKQRTFLEHLAQQNAPMTLVLESAMQGMSQYYVECQLETKSILPARCMVETTAVRVQKNRLFVRL